MAVVSTKSKKGNGSVEELEVDLSNVNRLIREVEEVKADPNLSHKDLAITPPNIKCIRLPIRGTRPLVQNRFGEKARQMMMEAQEKGSQGKKGKAREPKDFDKNFNDARYVAKFDTEFKPLDEEWDGIYAGGFRRAMVDACPMVGFHMTKAKKSLFIIPDGYDANRTPLVRITKGKPFKHIGPVRNASGVADLRSRPMWDIGWEATVTIEFDNDLFSANDVLNLLARVGRECGIAEGRPNSKESTGCDWGLFEILPVV